MAAPTKIRISVSSVKELPMPLGAVEDRQPIHDKSGVRFCMTDGNKIVGCLVSEEALQELSSGAIPDLHTAFNLFRDDIEAAASRKFDNGKVESDGATLIDFDDLWEEL
jgi:hypothetical protein